MPPVLAYSVDFSHGNLTPSVDVKGWGAMQQGNTGPGDKPENFSDSKGITLSLFRSGASPNEASNSIYVVPPAGSLNVQSRLLLHAEFDSPWAQPNYVPLSPSNFQTITSNTTQAGQAWAIALGCKFGNQNDLPGEKRVVVTCQFTKTTATGMRLNTPGFLQGDVSALLDTPLDYANYWPPSNTNLFVLEHLFCGVKSAHAPAGLGYSVGCGELTIGNRHDQRAYSNAGLSDAGAPTSIGALGITLVTVSGVGQIIIRLRKFSVSTWS